MKFNPITKDIYTDNGKFIKTMNCPFKISWNRLEKITSNARKCLNCNHIVLDTKNVSDSELLKIVKENPKTCLKIDLNQKNIIIESHGILVKK
jgi:hypothetical protein